MGGKAGGVGFKAAQAEIKIFGQDDDAVVRLDFDHGHRGSWKAGQHFHICFPSLSIW
jgi:ferric-chelate reductase